jgi:hypothetical protein
MADEFYSLHMLVDSRIWFVTPHYRVGCDLLDGLANENNQ